MSKHKKSAKPKITVQDLLTCYKHIENARNYYNRRLESGEKTDKALDESIKYNLGEAKFKVENWITMIDVEFKIESKGK